MDTQPKHTVHIIYDERLGRYKLYCTVCGTFKRVYPTLERAENRKSTHDREQDAGVDE